MKAGITPDEEVTNRDFNPGTKRELLQDVGGDD